MIEIELLDTANAGKVNEFVQLPFRLFKDCPQWVPPFIGDVKTMLNREKHPFWEHSEGDFFVARRGGRVVGRLSVAVNRPFNKYHDVKKAQFYLFECENDQEAANALFERGFEWARSRGLNEIVGPKGFSGFDGYGLQIEGFEHHQMMTMMNYNYPYYNDLVTNLGFEKEVDFVSCYMQRSHFIVPEKMAKVAAIVRKRGQFEVKNFATKRELIQWAPQIGQAYNSTFINNWEYYPLTQREVKFAVDNIMTVADHRLIKIITYEGKVVGFLFGFPDITPALQRGKGRINPISIADILISMKRTKWVSLNGVGVLPEYHGRGGNTILYDEICKTVIDFGFEHAELTQMAETAIQIRKDIITMGALPYKNHRVYHRAI